MTTTRLLVAGTLIAACCALAAVWAFVLRPAADETSTAIGVGEFLDGESGSSGVDLSGPTLDIGSSVSDLTLPGLDGDTIALSDLRGKIVVINFWASTCTPCVKEMPILDAAHRDLGESVAFVGVDVFESVKAGTAMVERTKVTYPQARDARSELFARFGGRQLPHTVVVDASGHLAARHNKVITSRAELDAMIDEAR